MQIPILTTKPSFFGSKTNEGVICSVCPHLCKLREGETGKCLVRENKNGKIVNKFEGYCSLLSVEPIEKRPFFHYRPGSKYLAVGFYGCSFSCTFCQNFKVSQTTEGSKLYKSPVEITDMSKSKSCDGVAFTFNEPTVYHEYICQVINQKVDVVVKSNGFVNTDILKEMSGVSAWNIDIKGDEDEYQNVCGGHLKPVLESIEYLKSNNSHVEISYLILPRMVSDMKFHSYIRDFVSNLSPKIPIHVLYFYPFHKMIEHKYDKKLLIPIVDLLKNKMENVYISNCFDSDLIKYRNTTCRLCDKIMIDRSGSVKLNSACFCVPENSE